MESARRQVRRQHGEDLKAKVLAACAQRGASVAKVALDHGLNANLVHRWRRLAQGRERGGLALADALDLGSVERVELVLVLGLLRKDPVRSAQARRRSGSSSRGWTTTSIAARAIRRCW